MKKELKLIFIAMDCRSRPVYKDDNGALCRHRPRLCLSRNSYKIKQWHRGRAWISNIRRYRDYIRTLTYHNMGRWWPITKLEAKYNAKRCMSAPSMEALGNLAMKEFYYDMPPTFQEAGCGHLYMIKPSGKPTEFFVVKSGKRFYLMHPF